MDLEKDENLESNSCSICFEIVVVHGDRSIAKLHCGHYFHLDCIGSAFNAKGSMQCPNCRKVEKGRWLFANGQRSSGPDLDFEGWLPDDSFDLTYSEQSFGFRWCPFGGVTQLASLLEDGESQLNSYIEPLNSTTYADHSNTSSTSHVCPYVALHGQMHGPHTMHISVPSSSRDSENIAFNRHSNNLGGVQQQPSTDMMNSHSFTSVDPQGQNWQHQNSHTHNFFGNGVDPWMSRDVGNQQRSGSFVHQRPAIHGHGPHPRSTQEQHMSHNHMYHHSVPSSSLRTAPFPGPPSSAAEYYGFATSANPGPQQYEHMYDWGRGRDRPNASLPWIPLEGESQWWGPFTPGSAPQVAPRMPRSSYM